MKKLYKLWLLPVFALFLLCIPASSHSVQAAASAVAFGALDYEKLTMEIHYNGNSIVYYSTDNAVWTEVEGNYSSASGISRMDISWVSAAEDVTLYFKGDVVKTVKSITIPAQDKDFKVIYDKVEGEFTFDDTGVADYFEWRKSGDYYWNKVSLNEASASYLSFLSAMESLRVKGASLLFRLPQAAGTGAGNTGSRPSAEITVKILARGTAPTVKVNASKLTVNTTTSMEYYDEASDFWMECDRTMSLEDIAPAALYENGAKTVTLQIRKGATATVPYSKTAYLTIPGQSAPTTIGDSSKEVTYYYLNSKLVMQFNRASAAEAYEYTIVKAGNYLNVSTASWKSVTNTKLMTLSASTAPEGCTIYVRRKGKDASTTAELVLPSAINSFTVRY